MGMLEKRGLYDPYDERCRGLDNEAGRMWRECRDLRRWRKNMGWEYYDKEPLPNRWLVIGGVLVVTEAFSAIILRFTALILIVLTVLAYVYVYRRTERMMQTKLNADPLLQRSQQIINATKAYAVLLDHYNAWFRAYPDDTERLDRVCAFLARAQAALVRKTTNFNAFIKMMETKRYVESNPGDRVALAELTAEPDQILALASECGLSNPDEILSTLSTNSTKRSTAPCLRSPSRGPVPSGSPLLFYEDAVMIELFRKKEWPFTKETRSMEPTPSQEIQPLVVPFTNSPPVFNEDAGREVWPELSDLAKCYRDYEHDFSYAQSVQGQNWVIYGMFFLLGAAVLSGLAYLGTGKFAWNHLIPLIPGMLICILCALKGMSMLSARRKELETDPIKQHRELIRHSTHGYYLHVRCYNALHEGLKKGVRGINEEGVREYFTFLDTKRMVIERSISQLVFQLTFAERKRFLDNGTDRRKALAELSAKLDQPIAEPSVADLYNPDEILAVDAELAETERELQSALLDTRLSHVLPGTRT